MGHAHAVVAHTQEEGLFTVFDDDPHSAVLDFALQAMDDGVFDQRLEDELGHAGFQKLLVLHFDFQREFVSEAAFLYREIILHVVQFVGEGHGLLHVGYGVAVKSGQRLRGLRDLLAACHQGIGADGLQAVVEKMGVDLVLQGQILRLLLLELLLLLAVKLLINIF